MASLMHGLHGQSERAVIDAIRAHDAEPQVASFLQYWASLSLMTGFCAPGTGDHVQTAYIDWYRGPPGRVRYMPALAALRSDLEAFILQGWMPTAPPIQRDRLVTALGSCFADEIRIWLRARGYRVNEDFRSGGTYPHLEDSAVPLLQCSAGLVNTFVLRQQFEWALEGATYDDDLWVGAKGTIATPTEAARRKTCAMFMETSLFVITLGLSEVWYQRRGGATRDSATCGEDEGDESGDMEPLRGCDVLWRAVPSDRYDASRHGFRATTVSENVSNLRRIVRLVRKHVPGASIVFTVSPVPLAATFRGVSCVTANASSKAVLRVAVDELMRGYGLGGHALGEPGHEGTSGDGRSDGVGGLFYWPAYEMVKEGFRDAYLDDGRHPKPEVVREILELFGKHYLPPESAAAEAGAPAPAAEDEPPMRPPIPPPPVLLA